jgi:hypothetical protein
MRGTSERLRVRFSATINFNGTGTLLVRKKPVVDTYLEQRRIRPSRHTLTFPLLVSRRYD